MNAWILATHSSLNASDLPDVRNLNWLEMSTNSARFRQSTGSFTPPANRPALTSS